ncbi:Non-specific lipid transfer protein GPI-anchored 2 [Abeliophyllum distichum]|uniref:Non-specific lipid transfer protein GPI-anchored 2 n=1 Tax=Abeliophyllum distichum TaxID=126358 RepID=A0ABD1TE02_9LAMI
MAKLKSTTTSTATIAYPLIITALFLVVLPRLTAQSTPVSAPEPPVTAGGPGPSTAPSPDSDCFNALLNLSDCLTFVETGSNLSKPDKGCCPEFNNLLNTQPVCLCQLLGDPSKIGFSIDTKKALKLPSACGVNTPSVSLCAVIGVPVGVLAPSESPSSLNGPAAAKSSPGNDGNGSPRNLASTQHFLVGLAILIFTNLF